MEVDTPALVVLGAALVLVVMADLVWTVVSVGSDRGPLTTAVAKGLYQAGGVGTPTHRRRQIHVCVAAQARAGRA